MWLFHLETLVFWETGHQGEVVAYQRGGHKVPPFFGRRSWGRKIA